MGCIGIVKTIGGFIIGEGILAIVGNVVKATTPAAINGLNKIIISIGAVALSGWLAKESVDFIEEEVTEVVELFKEEKKKQEEKMRA